MSTPTVIPPKRSWDDLIKASNGQMIRFPEKLTEAVKKWYADRTEFQAKVRDLAKSEHHLNHEVEQFLFATRQYLGEIGVEGAWSADIGVNMDALKDGEFVVNITQNVQK